MKRFTDKVLLFFQSFLATFFFAGCTTHTYLPISRFDFPESHGEWLWSRIQYQYQGATRIEVFPNFTDSPPNFDRPFLTDETNFFYGTGFELNAGLGKRFELIMKAPIAPAPALLGVKIQWLGNYYDKRQQNDFALATSLLGGYSRQEVDSIPTGGGSHLSQAAWAGDFALIMGFRPIKDLLVYGGPFFTKIFTDGNIVQSIGSFPFSETGLQWGGNLGIQWSLGQWGVALEYTYVDLSWSLDRHLSRPNLGFALSKEF